MHDTDRAAGWLVSNIDLITPGGRVLDVACGRGRNAIALARAGFRVHAIDRNPDALAALAREIDDGSVTTAAIDLEGGPVDLGDGQYDAVVVFNYLHRPLFPALVRAVAPGGALIYETFTMQQAERGHPRNPAFLLQPGELPRLVRPLTVLRSREGEFDGKCIASVAARRAALDEHRRMP